MDKAVNFKSVKLIYSLIFFVLLIVCSCERIKADNKGRAEIKGMAYILPGNFYMGSRGSIEKEGIDEGDGRVGLELGVDELPRHTVNLKGFYIDKYEVTNSQYKKFVDATGRRLPDNPQHTYDPYIWKNGVYPPGMDDNPVSLVSYDDAVSYCKWAGKRLPTEAEWEKVCRGEDGRKWPWGNDFKVSNANIRELGLKRTAPVGGFPSDVSPYGVYDMAGNVREWTDSWYQAYPGSTLKRDLFGEKFRVMRGGSWVHPSIPESRCAVRGFVVPEIRHRSVGFRCAKD